MSVILAVTISYLFYSLAFNPKIVDLRGASAIQFTLQLGLVVVTFASAIIVLYANSFVMKNRSKELGVYGMLGLEKRHLIGMTFKELLIFGLVTVTAGIGIGALFDNLIFALLLKLAKMKVELVATFQWSVVLSILLVFGFIFLVIVFLNAIRIIRMDALQLSREKAKGEKKGRFLVLQTFSRANYTRWWLLPSTKRKRSSFSGLNFLHSRYVGHFCNLPPIQCRYYSFLTVTQEKQEILLPTK